MPVMRRVRSPEMSCVPLLDVMTLMVRCCPLCFLSFIYPLFFWGGGVDSVSQTLFLAAVPHTG